MILIRTLSPILYNVGMCLYRYVLSIVKLWNKKAAKLTTGQRRTFDILKEKRIPDATYTWFHAASLGEFEQGRPVIELLKLQKPETKILLTFFSPSGYEVRKNYQGADVVCYLPLDTKKHVNKFFETINISIAIFIKYEFWPNYLLELKRRSIPTFLISGIFRPQQLFFRWYGVWYKNILESFSRIFVQDSHSLELLQNYGIKQVTASGDTRFDRVVDLAGKSHKIPLIENFVQNSKNVIVAGSTWPKDEALLIRYLNKHPDVKLILVPHEIHESHIADILKLTNGGAQRFSEVDSKKSQSANCLLVDSMGLLSSIYQYAQVAYIGGGFGAGIHNTLEAAAWNIPVVFGPNYQKFREARELIDVGGGFTVDNYENLEILLNELLINNSKAAEVAGAYVTKNTGATRQIVRFLQT